MLFSRTTNTAAYTSFVIEFTAEEMKDCRGMDGLAELDSDDWYPGGKTTAECIVKIPDALRLLAAMSERIQVIEEARSKMTVEEQIKDLERRIQR